MKYLGIKLVDAEPMTLEEFNAKYPGRVVNPISGDGVNGYCVTYPDGYQGWCPKEVFEEANIPIEENVIDGIINRLKFLDIEPWLQKVKCVQDESYDWFVIPTEIIDEFFNDLEDEDMVDSGEFDEKYRKYATGGDLNLFSLYTPFYK